MKKTPPQIKKQQKKQSPQNNFFSSSRINLPRQPFTLQLGCHRLHLGKHTKIMGIMNLTPDSFSQDGRLKDGKNTPQKNLNLAKKLIQEGADILDIGGESTRPGAKSVGIKEEIKRVIPTIRLLSQKISTPISIDTYKTTVAQHALDAGASIVNNIMGTKLNQNLLKMIRDYDAGIILMHIKGTPRTMQKQIHYNNLIKDILENLKRSIENCLEIGIKSDRIMVDPGIGFGKTVRHNLEIIEQLTKFRELNCPLLIGTSRKSFIGKILNSDVRDRLSGTLATVCASILRGAHVVRAHDITATKDAVTMTDAILNYSEY